MTVTSHSPNPKLTPGWVKIVMLASQIRCAFRLELLQAHIVDDAVRLAAPALENAWRVKGVPLHN